MTQYTQGKWKSDKTATIEVGVRWLCSKHHAEHHKAAAKVKP